MVISLALLGLAVVGRGRRTSCRGSSAVAGAARWPAVFTLAFALTTRARAARSRSATRSASSTGATTSEPLLKLYIAAALPFLCSGFALTIAISSAGEKIGRIYAFDLCGAALGCLFVIPAHLAPGRAGRDRGRGGRRVAAGAVLRAGAAGLGAAALRAGGVRGRDGDRVVGAGRWRALERSVFGIARNPEKFLGEPRSSSRAGTRSRGSPWARRATPTTTGSSSTPTPRPACSRARSRRAATRRRGAFSEVRVAGAGVRAAPRGPGADHRPGRRPRRHLARCAPACRSVVGVEVNPIIADAIMRGRSRTVTATSTATRACSVVVDDGRSYIRRSERGVLVDPGHAGGHLGGVVVGRVHAVGEQPLHRRGLRASSWTTSSRTACWS